MFEVLSFRVCACDKRRAVSLYWPSLGSDTPRDPCVCVCVFFNYPPGISEVTTGTSKTPSQLGGP